MKMEIRPGEAFAMDDDFAIPHNPREYRDFKRFDRALRDAQTTDKEMLSKNLNLAARIAAGLSSSAAIQHVVWRLCLVSRDSQTQRETAVYATDTIMRHVASISDDSLLQKYEKHISVHLLNLFKRALRTEVTRKFLADRFLNKILPRWKKSGWFESDLELIVDTVHKYAPSLVRPPVLSKENLVRRHDMTDDESEPEADADDGQDVYGGGLTPGVPPSPGMLAGSGAMAKAGMPQTPIPMAFLQGARMPGTPASPARPVVGTPEVLASVPRTPSVGSMIPRTPGGNLGAVPMTPGAGSYVPMTPGLAGMHVPMTPGVGLRIPMTPKAGGAAPMTPAAAFGGGDAGYVPMTPGAAFARAEGSAVPQTPVHLLTGAHVPMTPMIGSSAAPMTPALRMAAQAGFAAPSTPGGEPSGGSAAPMTPAMALQRATAPMPYTPRANVAPYTPRVPFAVPNTPAGAVPMTPRGAFTAPYTPAGQAGAPATPRGVVGAPMPYTPRPSAPPFGGPVVPHTPVSRPLGFAPFTPRGPAPRTPGLGGVQPYTPRAPMGSMPMTPGGAAPQTPMLGGMAPYTPRGPVMPQTPGIGGVLGGVAPYTPRGPAPATPGIGLMPGTPGFMPLAGGNVAPMTPGVMPMTPSALPGTPGFLPMAGGNVAPVTPGFPGGTRTPGGSLPGTPGFMPLAGGNVAPMTPALPSMSAVPPSPGSLGGSVPPSPGFRVPPSPGGSRVGEVPSPGAPEVHSPGHFVEVHSPGHFSGATLAAVLDHPVPSVASDPGAAGGDATPLIAPAVRSRPADVHTIPTMDQPVPSVPTVATAGAYTASAVAEETPDAKRRRLLLREGQEGEGPPTVLPADQAKG